MATLDWIVLILTTAGMVGYGLWKSRKVEALSGYLVGERSLAWWHICLSVMATQASAVTFLSGPSLAYNDGMRFLQFYLGLPLAMVVISVSFIPLFHKLNVLTAYQFLETRFNLKTRTLVAILFLGPRWLSTGISIYTPSIVLTVLFGWELLPTILCIGGVLLIYTVWGGSRAVSYTHLQQMFVVLAGMFLAGLVVVKLLPGDMGDSLKVAGAMGKMDMINWKFDLNDRYNIWSGLIGGFFLQWSYFGTDQSQVGRYLGGESIAQSRAGLLWNGLLKIPMQFGILLVGVLIFVFYQFHQPPLLFNTKELSYIEKSADYQVIKQKNNKIFQTKKQVVTALNTAFQKNDTEAISTLKTQLTTLHTEAQSLRKDTQTLLKAQGRNPDDTNYVFLYFVIHQLPKGLVGLLVAVIFLSAMGSISSALQSLASCFIVDIYQRLLVPNATDQQYVRASRVATFVWGVLGLLVAVFAARVGSLLEAVNILGSLFYGTILGVFVVAFYVKSIRGNATFWAAVFTEIIVVVCWWNEVVAFLWLNVLGCLSVVLLGWCFERIFFSERQLLSGKSR